MALLTPIDTDSDEQVGFYHGKIDGGATDYFALDPLPGEDNVVVSLMLFRGPVYNDTIGIFARHTASTGPHAAPCDFHDRCECFSRPVKAGSEPNRHDLNEVRNWLANRR